MRTSYRAGMLEEIARNKRRSVFVIMAFLVTWAGIGALLGALFGGNSGSGSRSSAVVVGIAVAGVFALLATVYTLTSGTRLVLAVSGAQPADAIKYRQLHDVVEAMSISAGLAKPAVFVIDDPSPTRSRRV